jgi:hypothetical protein
MTPLRKPSRSEGFWIWRFSHLGHVKFSSPRSVEFSARHSSNINEDLKILGFSRVCHI